MDMKKLLEKIANFAGEPEQKPGDQVKGTDNPPKGKDHPFKGKLVGAAESKGASLKELDKLAESKDLEWQLAEEFSQFKKEKENFGTKEKRVGRKGTRSRKKVEGVLEEFELGVSEGWESGPDEGGRSMRDLADDPDWGYDQARQEKADAGARAAQEKRPQQKVYTLVGRGPNMEPNYKFPGEYASQAEADAARKELMADPSTPNPRMIGISTHTRYLDLKEGIESADPIESAVLSAVQDLIQQGHTEVAPEVITNMVVAATSQPFLLKDLVDANKNSPAIQHYVDSINPSKVKFSSDILTVKNEDPLKDKKQAENGVAKMAAKAASRPRLGESRAATLVQQYQELSERLRNFKESRGHKLIARKLKGIEARKHPISDEEYAKHAERMKAQQQEYSKRKPKKVDEVAPAVGMAANQQLAKQAIAAASTLKSATNSPAPAPNIAKAIDAAAKGTAVTAQDMQTLAPVMNVVQSAAQDPKLANQFKLLAQQTKTP